MEAPPYHPRRPHTTDDGLLDQDGYNSTRTSLTFQHLILQACEYPALVALDHLLLAVPTKAALHLAVAPTWLTGPLAEHRTLLPHFEHPLGSQPTCLLFSRASASSLTNTILAHPHPFTNGRELVPSHHIHNHIAIPLVHSIHSPPSRSHPRPCNYADSG